MAEQKPVSQEDEVEIIDHESDNEGFEDASDSLTEGPHDLTRPSEWKPRPDKDDNDDQSEEFNEAREDVVRDSLGHDQDSPDFIDEELLKSWEEGDEALSETQLEQKRLEAAQYKLEGNSLYTEGKTREACGKV